MSDYLACLAAKALGASVPSIQPRLPSRFESEPRILTHSDPFPSEPPAQGATDSDVMDRARSAEDATSETHSTMDGISVHAQPAETSTVSERKLISRKHPARASSQQPTADGAVSKNSRDDLAVNIEILPPTQPSIPRPETKLKPLIWQQTEPVRRQNQPPIDTQAPAAPRRRVQEAVPAHPEADTLPQPVAATDQAMRRPTIRVAADEIDRGRERLPRATTERIGSSVQERREDHTPARILNRDNPPAPNSAAARPMDRSAGFAMTRDRVVPRESPTIRITIGRVDVRAVAPPPPKSHRTPPAPRRPIVTLDEYLQRRNSGS